jgi:tetratricopeptide (TPR) repeat protein
MGDTLRCLPLLAAAMFGAGSVVCQEGYFEEANQLYLDGNFELALDRYNQILSDGYESAPLYYNLGNTHFKLGQLARSVLNYERALRLDPGDTDAEANLALVRSLTADDVRPLPRFWPLRIWDWWLAVITRGWLPVTIGLLYATTAGSLTVTLLVRRREAKQWAKRLSVTSALLLVVLSVHLAAGLMRLGVPTEAVILAREVLVQSAPSEDRALQVFTIHSGTKVRVDQQSGEWAEIVLEDGKVGWVKRDVFEII